MLENNIFDKAKFDVPLLNSRANIPCIFIIRSDKMIESFHIPICIRKKRKKERNIIFFLRDKLYLISNKIRKKKKYSIFKIKLFIVKTKWTNRITHVLKINKDLCLAVVNTWRVSIIFIEEKKKGSRIRRKDSPFPLGKFPPRHRRRMD